MTQGHAHAALLLLSKAQGESQQSCKHRLTCDYTIHQEDIYPQWNNPNCHMESIEKDQLSWQFHRHKLKCCWIWGCDGLLICHACNIIPWRPQERFAFSGTMIRPDTDLRLSLCLVFQEECHVETLVEQNHTLQPADGHQIYKQLFRPRSHAST